MNRLESQLQAAFLLAVPKEIPTLRVFRRNVGVVRIEDRIMRFGVRGQSDLFGLEQGGRHIEIELKSPRGILTSDQKVWRDWCFRWQVPYILLQAKPDESQLETVARWCREVREYLSASRSLLRLEEKSARVGDR